MDLLDRKIADEFRNKKILITGGTGSVGTAITRQLIKFKPKLIRILTNDEFSIYETRKILGNSPPLKFELGDIRDKDRMNLAIRDIDMVFHCAALKHIDMCEENPFETAKTNVTGTSNVLEASLQEDVSKFIFISTDKALNPTSTLGASKLLGEKLTIHANRFKGKSNSIFAVVRFGNVIGSRGSVFQIFLDLMRRNLPLTVTDIRMTRFIMSLNQAANLILSTTNIAKDGEVFILKMPSVKIVDFAREMINVYNARYPKFKYQSKMKISEARKGERLYELLISPEEMSYCHDIGVAYKISNKKVNGGISSSNFNSNTASRISTNQLQKIMTELLNEYS